MNQPSHVEQHRRHEAPGPCGRSAASASSVRWKRSALRSSHEPIQRPTKRSSPRRRRSAICPMRRRGDEQHRDRHQRERGQQQQDRQADAADRGARGALEQRPGDDRREAEEQAVREHHEELPRDGGDDAVLGGDAAVALQQPGLDRLGEHGARGQAEHQRVADHAHGHEPAEARARRRAGRSTATSRAASASTASRLGTQQQRQPGAARAHELERPRRGRPSAAPRRAARATGAPAGAATRGAGAASCAPDYRPSLPFRACRAYTPLSREAHDTGPAEPGDVRLGVPLGARGARHRLGDQGVGGGPGGARPRGATARRSRPSWRRPRPAARRSTRPAFLELPPAALAERCNGADRVVPPQPAARRRAGRRELRRLLPGARADARRRSPRAR